MAKRQRHPRRPHPDRLLRRPGVLYGLVALAGSWTPALGLDLQGGTRITLIAKDGDNSDANLEEARRIIDQRVNGSGVTEAEVTTQGNRFIVVEVPGESRRDLVETVKRQAQLRFRVVAQSGDGTAAPTQPSSSADPSGLPSEPLVTVAPSETATPKPSKTPKGNQTRPTESPEGETPRLSPKNRAPFTADQQDESSPATRRSRRPRCPARARPSRPPKRGRRRRPRPARRPADPDDPLQWMLNPDEESVAAFNAFTCPAPGAAPEVDDDPDKPLVTCDQFGAEVPPLRGDDRGQRAQDRQPAPAHPDERRVRRPARSSTAPAPTSSGGSPTRSTAPSASSPSCSTARSSRRRP